MNRYETFKYVRKSVCVIGLGNVGAGIYVHNKNFKSLDHVSAISKNSSLEITCGIDLINQEKYEFPVHKKISDIRGAEFDLVVIATPTSTHLKILTEIIRNINYKIILIEKPATSSIFEIEELAKLGEAEKIFVNYHRNYNPFLLDIFYDKTFGNIQKGVVYFSNGVLNNASHGVALVQNRIGEIRHVEKISNRKSKLLRDNFDFYIEGENESKIYFINTHESNYSNFRLNIDYENGVMEYDSSSGIVFVRKAEADTNFVGRKCLSEKLLQININEQLGFDYVYDYLSKKIRQEQVSSQLGVSLNDAFKIHDVLNQLV